MRNWYKDSFWRNLVDMHIPDWNPDFMTRFSSDQYANAMAKGGFDAVYLFATSTLGLCYWPSKVGHMHNGLHGQDIVSPTLKLCQDQGVHTILYIDIWSRWAYDNFPGWRMVSIDGYSSVECHVGYTGKPSRFGVCCMNSPYRDFIKLLVTEICTNFKFDGLWVDMIGWNGTVCYCSHCRQKYFNETGKEIPTIIDWFNPDWVQFQRKREEWYADFANMINETALNIKPDISIAHQSATVFRGWGAAVNIDFLYKSDYMSGDYICDPIVTSIICKMGNSMTTNKPAEFMTSYCVSLYDHTTIKTPEELRHTLHCAYAHNTALLFIDAINPDGTLYEVPYDTMSQIHCELKKYEEALAPDAVMCRDVSVYQNFESMIDPSINGTSIRDVKNTSCSPIEHVFNMASAFIHNHILFDLTCPQNINEAVNNSQVILLSQVLMLSEDEISVLSKFVHNGGSLFVTGNTSLCDKAGHFRKDFALAELTGIHYKGQSAEDITYLVPTEAGKFLFDGFTSQHPMALHAHSILAKADQDVTVLATLALPYSHSKEVTRFSSANSDPPGYFTEYPMATVRSCGKGRVMYFAAPLEMETYTVQKNVLCNLISYLGNTPLWIKTNAPPWLETIVYYDDIHQRYQIFICKVSTEYLSAIARDVMISIRVHGQPGVLFNISAGCTVNYSFDGNQVVWTVDSINDFAMFTLDCIL